MSNNPLRHAMARMGGRDPHEQHRAATPLELFFEQTQQKEMFEAEPPVVEEAIRMARKVYRAVERDAPLVAILWGRDAQALTPRLGSTPIVASAHPSPLSAARGFFGSRPFSRANQLLADQGAAPVEWQLPDQG